MRIAVLGANGFVGAELVNYLQTDNTVYSITRDNYYQFVGKKFDILINANGNSKKYLAYQDPFLDFGASTYTTYASMQDFKFDVYVLISTVDVYANTTGHCFEETGIIPSLLSPYGFNKYLSELIVKRHTKKFIILRCASIVGKYATKGVLYDIIKQQYLHLSRKSKLQFINVYEIPKIIERILQITDEYCRYTYNVSGIDNVLVNDIAPLATIMHNKIQIYDVNVGKLKSIYPIKTSMEYALEVMKDAGMDISV